MTPDEELKILRADWAALVAQVTGAESRRAGDLRRGETFTNSGGEVNDNITLPPLPEPARCRACYQFFRRYRCNAPCECDCPKCLGYCDCPRPATPPAPSAAPVPDDEYMIGMFSAAELRAYDYGCKESMDAFTRLLDGKGSRDGVCQPQWQALRVRVWKLMDASPPDHTAVMRQALEALEERYVGALRDNAIVALRAALAKEPK